MSLACKKCKKNVKAPELSFLDELKIKGDRVVIRSVCEHCGANVNFVATLIIEVR